MVLATMTKTTPDKPTTNARIWNCATCDAVTDPHPFRGLCPRCNRDADILESFVSDSNAGMVGNAQRMTEEQRRRLEILRADMFGEDGAGPGYLNPVDGGFSPVVDWLVTPRGAKKPSSWPALGLTPWDVYQARREREMRPLPPRGDAAVIAAYLGHLAALGHDASDVIPARELDVYRLCYVRRPRLGKKAAARELGVSRSRVALLLRKLGRRAAKGIKGGGEG